MSTLFSASIRIVVVTGLTFAVSWQSAGAEDEATPLVDKLPVPSSVERQQQRKLIANVFPQANVKTPKEKVRLAHELLEVGKESSDDPPAHFATCNIARELASSAGDIGLAYQAINELESLFYFDALAVKLSSLTMAANAPTPLSGKVDVVKKGLSLANALAADDRYDEAESLNRLMLSVARRIRDKNLLNSLNEQQREHRQLKDLLRVVKDAQDSLATDPEDAKANLVVGRYYSFIKREWEPGLEMLRKGDDPKLKAIADMEAAKPTASSEQVEIGDDWWEAGERESGVIRESIRLRAAFWYGLALPSLSGFAEKRIEKRIASITASKPGNEKPIELPNAGPVVIRYANGDAYGQIVPLRDEVKLFTDRKYTFQRIPTELQGLLIAQEKADIPSDKQLTVAVGAKVYICLKSDRQSRMAVLKLLKEAGWTYVGKIPARIAPKHEQALFVYAKIFGAKEVFVIPVKVFGQVSLLAKQFEFGR